MEDLSIAPVPFWYLRHGQTDWNVQGLSQGNVDIPLNETGLEQAKQAAVKMRHRGIVSIVSSPLSRARVTAEIVAEALGVDVILEPDLREVSWGVQEGKPLAE
jgi:broad specificity phosphatase PhoE